MNLFAAFAEEARMARLPFPSVLAEVALPRRVRSVGYTFPVSLKAVRKVDAHQEEGQELMGIRNRRYVAIRTEEGTALTHLPHEEQVMILP